MSCAHENELIDNNYETVKNQTEEFLDGLYLNPGESEFENLEVRPVLIIDIKVELRISTYNKPVALVIDKSSLFQFQVSLHCYPNIPQPVPKWCELFGQKQF